ncbi:TonB-linked SusC/RagA family outer membrane protein [Flavobacterium nitrogenifigens]|uniref:TonB-linked SusC/RagA family outer membrane protein n=2 Tax=Flavobacterium TaxID=237 RepID=A0A7W7N958_9FLAO|nr:MULTISPECIES: SusC/RagA family TonB-linked outer membrane protein [Flavobacterium]MBB4804680.1 TonB-linked SusC/RagA family outer membrane protein [Flavobacterium nitrogenifigens]MBB6389639.1 TonB-linked SusC/RagA family outer membrane protein [Flavobacterium notoginsengisoli]
MKLTTLFLLTALSVMHAGTSYSQKSKISFNVNNMTVAKVIERLEYTTDYRFVYNVRSVDLNRVIDVNASETSIEVILNKIFNNTSTDFKVSGNHIILMPKKLSADKTAEVKKPEADFIVKGRVTDSKGMPLVGAAVADNGSGRGVNTDFNGEYQIIAVSSETTLAFSYLGFIRQEIKVDGRSVINVVLKEDVQELEGVVLTTGYQSIAAEQATGAYSNLKSKDFAEQRLSSINAILEGRVAGYQNGKIRGTTSMTGVTAPLYVIDGFPVENTKLTPYATIEENVPNLNLEDIETITVLKDAAASSIYGARAANGVVVITTKKAKAGKTTISFSSNLTIDPYRNYTGNLTDSGDIIALERGWANGNPNLKTANAATYAQSLLNNAVFTSLGMQTILNGYAGKITQADMNSRLDALGSQGYKYFDDIAKYAKRDQYFMQHNLSLGKATESNTFNASITYKNNQLENIHSENESVGINIKNSTQINSWLSLDLGTYLNYGTGDTQSYFASDPAFTSGPGFKYQPYNQLVNNDGTNFVSTAASRYNNFTLQSIQNYGLYNMDITPMDEFGRNLIENKSFQNRTFAKFNVKFSKAFSYNAMFQYEYGSDRASQLFGKDSYYVRSKVNGMVTIANNKAVYNLPYGDIIKGTNQFTNAYNFRQQLNFNQTFNDKHDFSAIAGMEMRHMKLEYNDNTRYGYDSQTLAFTPINQADLLKVYGSVFSGYMSQQEFSLEKELLNRYVSVYSTGGYTYNNKYNLSGSVRWDRSNLWGTDSKYQNKPTWSAGAAWNIDKESFFKVSWVDALKIRTSYGIGGNVAKDSAPYLTAYYNSNSNVGGSQGTINSRPNPELSWEKTTTTNVGLDFSLFKSRISGTVDYYNKKGEDLLASSQGIPTEGWGYSTYKINNGEMTNKGIEVTLRGTIVKTPSFSWDAAVLYANNKNKVDYVNVKAPVYYLQLDYPQSFPRVGNNFNTIYGYKWAGLSSAGLPQVYDASGTAVKFNPGQLDAIKDFGSTVPTHSGSFHTSANYKNFSLSALFIYELGHKIRNTFLPMLNNSYNSSAGGYVTNITTVNKNIENRWQQPGDEAFTNVPRVVYEYEADFSSDSRTIYSYADINILDASNVRLSNVSLSYQLPKDFLKRVKLDGVRFNLNAENVYTFAKSRDAKYLLNGFQSPNYVMGVNVNF